MYPNFWKLHIQVHEEIKFTNQRGSVLKNFSSHFTSMKSHFTLKGMKLTRNAVFSLFWKLKFSNSFDGPYTSDFFPVSFSLLLILYLRLVYSYFNKYNDHDGRKKIRIFCNVHYGVFFLWEDFPRFFCTRL